jgi:predicted DCC family thiol-disulfide oxidoreductase YuxK
MNAAFRPESMLVLYDGVCALCNGVVRFLIRRDRDDRYRFAAIQSEYARALLRKHGKDPDRLDTMYLVLAPGAEGERVVQKGRAALRAVSSVGGGWRLLRALAVLPTFLLDAGYWVIARTRYRLFGKSEACPVPAVEDRHKFVG